MPPKEGDRILPMKGQDRLRVRFGNSAPRKVIFPPTAPKMALLHESPAELSLKHVHGFSGTNNGLHFVGEKELVYPCSGVVVLDEVTGLPLCSHTHEDQKQNAGNKLGFVQNSGRDNSNVDPRVVLAAGTFPSSSQASPTKAAKPHPSEQRVFFGHSTEVTCVDYNHTKRVIASGQRDPKGPGKPFVCVWRAADMMLISVLVYHEAQITCVGIAPKGDFLFTMGRDDANTVAVWAAGQFLPEGSERARGFDAQREAVVHRAPVKIAASGKVPSFCCTVSFLAAPFMFATFDTGGFGRGILKVWRFRPRLHTRHGDQDPTLNGKDCVIAGSVRAITAAAFTLEQNLLLACGDNGILYVYEGTSIKRTISIVSNCALTAVLDLCMPELGFLAASADGCLHLIEARAVTEMDSEDVVETLPVNRLAGPDHNPNLVRLLCSTSVPVARCFSIAKANPKHHHHHHHGDHSGGGNKDGKVLSAGEQAAAAAAGKSKKGLSTAASQRSATASRIASYVSQMSGGGSKTASGEETGSKSGAESALKSKSRASNGQSRASGSKSSTKKDGDEEENKSKKGSQKTVDSSQADKIESMVAQLQGQMIGHRVAIGCQDSTVFVVDLLQKKVLEVVQSGHKSAVAAMARQGNLVATGSSGGDLRFWNLKEPRAPLIGRVIHFSAVERDDGNKIKPKTKEEVQPYATFQGMYADNKKKFNPQSRVGGSFGQQPQQLQPDPRVTRGDPLSHNYFVVDVDAANGAGMADARKLFASTVGKQVNLVYPEINRPGDNFAGPSYSDQEILNYNNYGGQRGSNKAAQQGNGQNLSQLLQSNSNLSDRLSREKNQFTEEADPTLANKRLMQPAGIASLAFADNYLAIGFEDGFLRILDFPGLQPVDMRPLAEERISCLQFSPDQRLLVAGSFDQMVYVLEVVDNNFIQDVADAENLSLSVVPTPSRSSFSKRNNNRAANQTRIRVLAALSGNTSSVLKVGISLDNSILMSNGADGSLLYYDLRTFERYGKMRDFRDVQFNVAMAQSWATQGIWASQHHWNSLSLNCVDSFSDLCVTGDDDDMVKLFPYPATFENTTAKDFSGHAGQVLQALIWQDEDDRAAMNKGGIVSADVVVNGINGINGPNSAHEDKEQIRSRGNPDKIGAVDRTRKPGQPITTSTIAGKSSSSQKNKARQLAAAKQEQQVQGVTGASMNATKQDPRIRVLTADSNGAIFEWEVFTAPMLRDKHVVHHIQNNDRQKYPWVDKAWVKAEILRRRKELESMQSNRLVTVTREELRKKWNGFDTKRYPLYEPPWARWQDFQPNNEQRNMIRLPPQPGSPSMTLTRLEKKIAKLPSEQPHAGPARPPWAILQDPAPKERFADAGWKTANPWDWHGEK
ncbi:unnamed protein product [Amoebophrya sp. A120]|nr:unnamed protein product [Amoebophrya sp. A120]|eukprot:GSA120T00022837001.1